jgi:outer membrane autotransporter protein
MRLECVEIRMTRLRCFNRWSPQVRPANKKSNGLAKPSSRNRIAGLSLGRAPTLRLRASVLALMTALSASAWAGDGGTGFGLASGSSAGGTDGDATQANGTNASLNTIVRGGGGGATITTTGFGGAGGWSGAKNLFPNGPGSGAPPAATGSAGAVGISVTNQSYVGGNGGAASLDPGTAGAAPGAGGGGVGITTGNDLTLLNGASIAGGAGGSGNVAENTGAGGGGGAGVFASSNVSVASGASITGGAGGAGGLYAGAGGGGMAVIMSGSGTLTNAGTLTGGVGGTVGSNPSTSGQGGSGGEGVWISDGGTLVNQAGGTITGGASSALSGSHYSSPLGGTGVVGNNATIINAGTITGGANLAPGATGNADAIQFTGGVNTLELLSTSTITGNVVAFSSADTLALSGSTNGGFDVSTVGATAQYQGFGIYDKTGTSTWTLTGATTALMPWNLTGGTLSISSDANLGASSGTLTFDGATLQTTADVTMDRATTLDASGGTFDTDSGTTLTQQGQIGGAGSLTKTGAGNLTLTGNNTYTGATTISSGTLALSGTGSIAASSGVQDDGVFDISATSAGASINTLAGTGMVNLGAETLSLTAAASTFSGVIEGTGGLTLDGAEALTGVSTYTGNTTISSGTLALTGAGSIASSSSVQDNGLFDISGTTAGTSIKSLAGNGVVNLGQQTLALTAANDTFSGNIEGPGGLTLDAGTETLNGINSYTGTTTISGGTLALAGTGSIGSSSGVLDNGVFDISATSAGTSIKSLSGTGTVNLGAASLSLTAAADTFSGVIQGSGGLTLDAGTETLTGANTYTGNTTISSGTLVVGDAAHPTASIGSQQTTIAAGAMLAGYGTAAGSVTNAGTIAVADTLPAFSGAGLGTFRVAGNYTGTNGQLLLNAQFNDGLLPPQSDELLVGGNVSGTTAIVVRASGLGVPTVGDGVELVQVGGTSAANSFHLATPVQAGAYQYLLYQGGETSTNSNWYLRSVLDASNTTVASAQAAPLAYRPAVVGYSLTPSLNVDFGFAMLGRLQDRVGDVASLQQAQAGNDDGVWGRIGGQSLDADSMNRFSTDEQTFFAQFGKDWTLDRSTDGGSTHAGVTVNLGSSSASFNDDLRSISPQLTNATGSVETQAQTLGGYWTRYLPDGTYFDGVGQLAHYRNQYGDVLGDSATQNGFGAGMSGEVGKPFALGSSTIAIEPQAQLLYQYVHLNHFDDDVSSIDATTTNALRGRLGFRMFRANLSNDTHTGTATPYFTADVLHDFFSPGQTNVGGTSFDNGLGKTWYELGVGVTTSMGRASEMYASVRYEHNIGGEYRQNVFGEAGYRYSW